MRGDALEAAFLPLYVHREHKIRSPRMRFLTRCIHFLTVIFSWLFAVPLTVCRIYKCLFSGNIAGLLSLPLDVLSTEHVIQDCIQVSYSVFPLYLWLRILWGSKLSSAKSQTNQTDSGAGLALSPFNR
ncbi:unnamed protein product [Dibothriocephalus latus]|uniref:Uncharacterized protein n=1 Tax=Dibothriocephalus latus TaxID=60516 RepID=A0A3P7MK24_DIBLA|nr:unnamed protein product [Dibothriocephalus latus]